jgi:hypothetical protein
MKRIHSIHYTILLISCIIGATAFAQQKPFVLTYQLAGLGSNRSNTYYPITIKGNSLSYTLLNDKKKAVVHEVSIRQSSVDSIIRAVRIFYKDTTVFVANNCIMSGGVHYMTVQTPQAEVKFEMMNTFTPAAYKIAQILDKYLPEVLRLNITKEYVAAAWDCDLTIKSIDAAKEVEEQLFDSFCVRLVKENEYKQTADRFNGKLLIVEDPVTGSQWAVVNDTTDKQQTALYNKLSDEDKTNIARGHNFPCLPLSDTIFIIDAGKIFLKTYSYKKDGFVFILSRNFENRGLEHKDKCCIQLYGLRRKDHTIDMNFKIPDNDKAVYWIRFSENSGAVSYYRDSYDEDRFHYTCAEADPFR